MQIHGPYVVMVRDALTGELTDQIAAGEHYTASAELMVAHPELEPHRVFPSQLQNVWAGDRPDAPDWTVPLRFANAGEAAATLGALGLIPPT